MPEVKVKKLAEETKNEFYKVHCKKNGLDWCNCVAWWCDSWEEFKDRTAEENRKQREELFASDEYDGYLLYIDGEAIGWSQCGRRDRLKKLCTQYKLEPAKDTWAITCFAISPDYHGKGFAGKLLELMLEDLRVNGVRHVQSFPVRDAKDPWTGPISLYEKAGFTIEIENDRSPVFGINLC